MLLFGLIGFPLGHSFSPEYFSEKFRREEIGARYEAFPLENIRGLKALLEAHPELRGLNVTTPHKQSVIPFLHHIHAAAREIGAVNCIRIDGEKLYGFNTDWIGFRDSIKPLLRPEDKTTLLLGNGGASKAVQYALDALGISYQIISRTEGRGLLSYDALDADLIAQYQLIINTTTLGTLGKGLPLLPYDALTPQHLLFDLVYNPGLTPFLDEGRKRGARIKNGREMLELQAEAAWETWNSTKFPETL